MHVPDLRSPHVRTGGLVYFARMLDKIRLHHAGRLPSEYHPNLGAGFDGQCCRFLWIDYPALVERTKADGSDDELLAWAYQQGRKPSDEEALVWNDFMRKRGWNDEASDRLRQRKAESELSERDDIQTFFDYIDADEDRDPRARKL